MSKIRELQRHRRTQKYQEKGKKKNRVTAINGATYLGQQAKYPEKSPVDTDVAVSQPTGHTSGVTSGAIELKEPETEL